MIKTQNGKQCVETVGCKIMKLEKKYNSNNNKKKTQNQRMASNSEFVETVACKSN